MSGSLFSGISSYEASAAFVMESIVILVGSWWLFRVVAWNSILDVAVVLQLPLAKAKG